jgi:hypothetical protein
MIGFVRPRFWARSCLPNAAGPGSRFTGLAIASILSTVLLGLGGCEVLTPERRFFEEPTTFTHSLFETPDECVQFLEVTLEGNCSEFIEFFPDGRANSLLGGGDIVLGGTYRIRGRRIRVQPDHYPDALDFLLSKDQSTMFQAVRGVIWERSQE